jgi:predicted RNA-binding protein YlqC (UPF0109 family)
MADLREDFVQYVVKALVSNPDAVSLRRVSDDRGEYLELTVDPVDMGKVIGKAGATAKSLRTLLRGVGTKDDLAPLPLKIVDPQEDQRAVAAEAPVADVPEAVEETEAAEPAGEPVEAAEPVAESEPVAVEDVAPPAEAAEPAAEAKDEHQELHERTKREMEELADLEL